MSQTTMPSRHQRQRPKGSGLIVHFRFDDEPLYWAARIAASQRKIPFYRYIMQAVEVLVQYDAQGDGVVAAVLKEKNASSLPNGSVRNGGENV